jgi:Ricin-type beta-trefoil lectin domain
MRTLLLRTILGGTIAMLVIGLAGARAIASTPSSAYPRTDIPGWLINANSAKCLVVQGPDNGAPVFQYTCLSYPDQFWIPLTMSTNRFLLKNRNSGRCLVVQGPDNGARGFQYTCHDEFADQNWIQAA